MHLFRLSFLLLKCQLPSLLGIPTYSGKYSCVLPCDNLCCLDLPKKSLDCASAVSSSLIHFAASKNSSQWWTPFLLSHWPEVPHFFIASITSPFLLSPRLRVPYVFFLSVRQLIYSKRNSWFVFIKFIAQMGPGLLSGSSVTQIKD